MINESIIVAAAFFAFLALTYRPIGRLLGKVLDARAVRIESELSEAIRLREEAQVMLSDYEKKYREIEAESETILQHARETAEQMRKDAEVALKRAVEARLAAAHQKIARAEEMAVQGVQRQVVDVALSAAKQVISEKMQNDADDSLIKLAMKDVDRIVH